MLARPPKLRVILIRGLLSFEGLANMENDPQTALTGFLSLSRILKTVVPKIPKIWDTLLSNCLRKIAL